MREVRVEDQLNERQSATDKVQQKIVNVAANCALVAVVQNCLRHIPVSKERREQVEQKESAEKREREREREIRKERDRKE